MLLAGCAACSPAEPLADEATLTAGERAYQRCFACHALDAATTGGDGPHLDGIVGRQIAAVQDYGYSPAMRAYGKSGSVWSRERLDAFLADPQAEVPDNDMGFFGIANAEERRALIAWLEARED